MSIWFGTALFAATVESERAAVRFDLVSIGVVAAVLLAGLIAFSYTTRAGVIARATTKEAVRQPLFLLLTGLAMALMVLLTFLPYFTLGEDVKMLMDCGLATLLISGLLLAMWTSSTSIAEEIEGKTAMTLLSKPINRRQFVVGKYIGILQSVLFMLVPLVLVFLALIYYKVGYDAQEATKSSPTTMERFEVIVQIVPALVLIFLEVSVLTAISVAISTRLPMIVNMVTCFTIFVIGHLAPVLVAGGQNQLPFVTFVARLIATVLPSLEAFNMTAAVATGRWVPADYLGYSLVYSTFYIVVAVLFAFILFEDRDLA